MKALVWLIKLVLRTYYGIVYPIRFIDYDHIPAEGPFILCSNHIAARDPLILILRIKRRMKFMAKKELFNNKLVGAVLAEGGAFPVDRGRADLSAVRESLRVLKSGDGLGIFPQGTRSQTNEHTQMHGGAALIAQRTGAPVIPAFIDGPYRPFHRTNIYLGTPVELSEFGTKSDSATISSVTDRIDGAIWALDK